GVWCRGRGVRMVDLRWWVAMEGYTWVDEGGTPLPPAAIQPDPEEGWPDCHLEPVRHAFREYQPLKVAGLFRAFADTPLTPAAILTFAGEYGHLGDEVLEPPEPPDPPRFKSPQAKERWEREMARFARLFDSLDVWLQAIERMRASVAVWDRLQRGKADEREIEELLEVVNRELSGDRFSVAFARARTPSGFTMQLVPVSLFAALWLQL